MRQGRTSGRAQRSALLLVALLLTLLLLAGLGWLLASQTQAPAGAAQPAVATGLQPRRATGTELEASSTASTAASIGTPSTAPATDHREESAAPPRVTTEIRVLDAFDREPIANAQVTLSYGAATFQRQTDELGSCRVPRSPSGESSRLRVTAAGHAHADLDELPRTTRSSWVEILLARSTDLHGQVLAADTGEPVPGATLTLAHPDCASCAPDLVISAADGSYGLRGVPLLRERVLVIEAPGFARSERPFELRAAEARTRQDIHLARGLEVAGRVVDWTSGEGLPGATLSGLVTDADGRFQGRALAPPGSSTVELVVHAPEHASLRFRLDTESEEELVLRLPQLAFLEGQVLDGNRQPVGARLRLRTWEPSPGSSGVPQSSPLYELPEGWSYSWDGPTDQSVRDETFRFAVLPWSLNLRLEARLHFGMDRLEKSIDRAGGPDSVQRIEFVFPEPPASTERPPPATALRGVVTLNGEGELSGTVRWSGPTGAGEKRFSASRFSLDVEPGDLTLSVSLDGLTRALPGSETTRRAPAEQVTGVNLDLEAPWATLAGTLRYEDGAPIPGGLVTATCVLARLDNRTSGVWRSTTSDAEGRYELRVSDLGLPYSIEASIPSGASRKREGVLPGTRDADLMFARSYPVLVRCIDALSGQTLAPGDTVQVLWRGEHERGFQLAKPSSPRSDPDGWSEFWLPSSRVDFLAWPTLPELAGHAPQRIDDVSLAEPLPARVQLVLGPGLAVDLELDPDTGPLPAGCDLLLVEPDLLGTIQAQGGKLQSSLTDLAQRRRLQFDAQGRARIVGLAPSTYRFVAHPSTLEVDPGEFQVHDSSPPVVLRWFQH